MTKTVPQTRLAETATKDVLDIDEELMLRINRVRMAALFKPMDVNRPATEQNVRLDQEQMERNTVRIPSNGRMLTVTYVHHTGYPHTQRHLFVETAAVEGPPTDGEMSALRGLFGFVTSPKAQLARGGDKFKIELAEILGG